ncbi:class I SAM-dependent methyltransferase [Microcoleus sp. FACHB-SPT15]|uniref:class I SAM-dependent methyltransferase n=1 Tax=Microcoleus sp. FACHB-SPT15 TaxID=2692830 RepID=UPI00178400A5|nr:class I SAM-dependent methyltransferase [Microcoleus sp. FACHB-SPT15]MBD1805025.1 class I SAM-dependent methyltransferase [Microcoleus sp. FACHB-SPT15]
MNQSLTEVKTYYDKHVTGKLRGFVEGNQRVERAWLTIEQWAPKTPQRILEVGCGIGDICWRMAYRWSAAEVVGLDVSSRSLEIARKLFGSSRLSFVEGPLVKGLLVGKFDLIVLMDVYEHIALEDRPALHEALRELRSDEGAIILAFPTPRHLAWLRQNMPEEIQPVDEDVNIAAIQALAEDISTEVLSYQEVDVWHEGDYAHSVLGNRQGWVSANKNHLADGFINRIIVKLLSSKPGALIPQRSKRLSLVHKNLGFEAYPDKKLR